MASTGAGVNRSEQEGAGAGAVWFVLLWESSSVPLYSQWNRKQDRKVRVKRGGKRLAIHGKIVI